MGAAPMADPMDVEVPAPGVDGVEAVDEAIAIGTGPREVPGG